MKIIARKEWLGESGYCNCLLVTMCRTRLSFVELAGDREVPNLESLAREKPDTAAWLHAQEFDYARLNSREVIRILSRSAGISRWPWGAKKADLTIVDVPGEHEAPVNRQFHVALSKIGGVSILKVTLQKA